MSDLQAVTFSEMMQTPVITRIVNRISTPLSLFQNFFGKLSGDNSAATDSVKGRDAGWDIFDATRQFSGARAPETGPTRVRKKPIGHVSAQLMRSHESIVIYDGEVYKTRPLGAQIGSTVDMRGMAHIRRQIQFMTQRFRNQREWMYSRMLRGGYNILPQGDNYVLQEYNASPSDGSIPINYQIPADNQSRLDMGTGSDILTDWSSAASDILGQCYKINKAMTRLHGRPLRHIWVNSTTFVNIQNNTGLQNIGGEAYRVFDSLSRRQVTSREGIPDTGFDVVFRAMPLWTFHVYDGVLSATSEYGNTDGTSTSETDLLIPDDYAIFLPDPDDTWEGLIDGSEVIRENVLASGREVQGFHAWATPVIDPPGQELKFLDNYLPVLYVPNCVAYGNVGS
jgi:hypothetical protein